jgi:NADPH:quinone reductase-like Zn-dependent oxidoreductase
MCRQFGAIDFILSKRRKVNQAEGLAGCAGEVRWKKLANDQSATLADCNLLLCGIFCKIGELVGVDGPQGDLIGKRLNIHGFWMYYDEYLPKIRAALTEAAKVVTSGKLTLPITTTYKPSQITEAVENSQRGGKVLLDFNPN